jgi:hypothetical protein
MDLSNKEKVIKTARIAIPLALLALALVFAGLYFSSKPEKASTSPTNAVGLMPTQPLSALDKILNFFLADFTGANIIPISGANELNSNKQIIADIYPEVSKQDGTYAKIPDGNYIRATFMKKLNASNDIKLYAKGTGTIKVYEKNSSDLITIFNINGENWYDNLLTDMTVSSDTFDLKFAGNISVDYIVDPTAWLTGWNY